MTGLTIVMYHYVRDLAASRYPTLKARTIREFEGQLDYIARHYQICSVRDVVEAIRDERPLPPRACLLTFDDGLLDHFTVVLPRLLARGLTASFYVPAAVVDTGVVLDTHKIQFILEAAKDCSSVVQMLRGLVDAARREQGTPASQELWNEYAFPSRLDSADVIFVKRVLQRGLPFPLRSAITRQLFDEFVAVDEPVLARELYMDLPQLRTLRANGMEIGGHGSEHVWLGELPCDAQQREIHETVRFLQRVSGGQAVDWAMCYPFGSYDGITLELLRTSGCAVGLTTRGGVARDLTRPLELPRLDTIDLPTHAEAAVSDWTNSVLRAPSEPIPANPGRI